MVFGKAAERTRFSTTAATATLPRYGSPLASPCTSRAKRLISLSLAEEVSAAPLREIPSAAAVAGPTTPSAFSPFFRWNHTTAS